MKLPKAEQNLGEWQAAIECLILVAEKNGPTMMARIGMMKAPCRGRVRVPPGRHRLDSRAIVSRGHGQVPNTSMDGQSMSTTNGLAWSQPRLQEGQNLAVDLAGAPGARLLWDQPRNPAGHRSSPG